jgi:hypothetical protein
MSRFPATPLAGDLQSRMHAEFLEQARHMAPHCITRNMKPRGDRLVAESIGDEGKDLTLPVR